jgi:PAS domain S-box-containing protein
MAAPHTIRESSSVPSSSTSTDAARGLRSPATASSAKAPDWDAVVHCLGVGIVVCDTSRCITAVNPSAQQLLLPADGQTWSEIPTAVDLYWPGSRTPLPPEEFPLWRGLAGDTFTDLELAIVHPTGQRYLVLMSGHPILGDGGQMSGAVMTLYDITRRYQTDKTLLAQNHGLKVEALQRIEDLQTTNQQLQQALADRRRQEDTIKLFFDLPFIGMTLADPKTGQLMSFNDCFCEILGYSRQELEHITWPEITHPHDLVDDHAKIGQILQGQINSFSRDKRFIRKDGTVVYTNIHVNCIRNDKGEVSCLLGTVQDITERQQALQHLAQNEARYREMFEGNPYPRWVVDRQTLAFLAVNLAAVQHYGYTEAEFLSMTLLDLHPTDDIERVKSWQTQPLEAMPDRQIWRHLKKDGTCIEVETTYKHLQFQGREARISLVNDITEQRRIANRLKDSEGLFRATFEQAAVGIAHVAPDGSWLRVNQTLCAIVGYTRDELLTCTFQDLTHPDDLETDLGFVSDMLAGRRRCYSMEKRYIRKDRSIVWINLTVALVRDDDHHPKYFISVVQDISASKQAEIKLKEYSCRLTGLHKMDREILARFQPQEIANSTLALLCQLLQCRQGLVTLFNHEAQVGDIIADNVPDASLTLSGTWLPLDSFMMAQHDAHSATIQRIAALNRLPSPALVLECLLPQKLQSAMVIPLNVGHMVLGEVILADLRPDYFQAGDEEVALEVTDHLAIALQNARLFEQTKTDQQRLKHLSGRLLEAQELERRHLAHELHDEIGQALTAVKLNLKRLERALPASTATSILEDCLNIADGTLQQVRNLSLDLRPSMLDDLGLLPALRWYVNRFAERTEINTTLVCDPTLPTLSDQIETVCFRIVQEALTNVARHAQAQAATVELNLSAHQLHLIIQDDGIGFNLDAVGSNTSMGLLGMKERATLIGGHWAIHATPGHGCRVNLWLSLPAEGERSPPQPNTGEPLSTLLSQSVSIACQSQPPGSYLCQ